MVGGGVSDFIGQARGSSPTTTTTTTTNKTPDCHVTDSCMESHCRQLITIMAIYSLGHRLHIPTALPRPTVWD